MISAFNLIQRNQGC